MKYYKVKKISDNKFNGVHPNGVNEGYTAEGFDKEDSFKVGNRLYLEDHSRWFRTSEIISIDNKNKIFTTKNSTYKFEIINENSYKKTK